MLFNSIHFAIFFPLVFLVHYALPKHWRWAWLLAASCYFYAAYVPSYLLVLGGLIILDYSLGKAIENANGKTKRIYLTLSIISNIGVLFFFKYFNFFQTSLASVLADSLGLTYRPFALQVFLPLGLSFHVFQSLSYVIEVYRGNYKAERHLGIYALYVMFFPQLVAGPIERPSGLLPQLHALQEFDYGRAVRGLRLMLWGFFKKLAVADQLALFVNAVFSHVHQEPGPFLLAGAIAFSIELYCDFSGYTDIARGTSEILGVTLMRNFENPFRSRSIAEFWRRWHISLSSWFRDYFFLPVSFALRSYGKMGIYTATFLTFAILGLWHGAAWTYVIMGALSGIYIVSSDLTKNIRGKVVSFLHLDHSPFLHRTIQTVFTFALVVVGWIFFRAQSVSDGFYILTNLTRGWNELLANSFKFNASFELVGISKLNLLLALSAWLLVMLVEWSGEKGVETKADALPKTLRLISYYSLTFWMLWFGFFGAMPFIYFQF